MSDSPVTSPCIRNCCLDENDVCCGCFRTLSEITAWGGASEEQKRHILKCCENRRLRKETKNKSWSETREYYDVYKKS